MDQQLEGIVLRTIKYNDRYLIADMYTNKLGRASFLVPKSSSKRAKVKSSLFQPLSLLSFIIQDRTKGSLYRITEVRVTTMFVDIPYDARKLSIAFFIADFLQKSLKEQEENRPLYSFLYHSLVWLDNSSAEFSNFHLVFLLRLTRFLGIYPHLEDYVPNAYFDLLAADFSLHKPLHTSFISQQEAQFLLQLMRLNYRTMYLFKMTREQRNRALELVIDFYKIHLPELSTMKTMDVLKQLFI